jgi:hypothetical protein
MIQGIRREALELDHTARLKERVAAG